MQPSSLRGLLARAASEWLMWEYRTANDVWWGRKNYTIFGRTNELTDGKSSNITDQKNDKNKE